MVSAETITHFLTTESPAFKRWRDGEIKKLRAKQSPRSSWVYHSVPDAEQTEQHRQAVAKLVPLPDPAAAQNTGEFISMLRQVRAYSGLTLRDIEQRAGKYELPRSSISDMLKKDARLPKPERMSRYLAVCGLDEEQITAWEAAHRRLAMEQAS